MVSTFKDTILITGYISVNNGLTIVNVKPKAIYYVELMHTIRMVALKERLEPFPDGLDVCCYM